MFFKDKESKDSKLESELNRIRLQLSDEVKDLRIELERQRSENSELLLRASSKIDNAKDEITGKAIEKTLELLSHVRNWILVIALIFSAGAFLGWQGLDSYMKSYLKEKVELWLRFEDEESGAKKALEEIRTQVILDAYIIRLARSYASPYGKTSVTLTDSEIKRLLEIVLKPETPYSDFSDALRLITKSRGVFRLYIPEDEVGEKIIGILGSDSYDAHKKGLILEFMGHDGVLLPTALAILNENKNSENVRIAAFNNVAKFQPEYALEFAKENINEFSGLWGRTELAKFIATSEPNATTIATFLKELSTTKPENWEYNYLDVVNSLLVSESVAVSDYFANTLRSLILNGLSLGLTDSAFGPQYISFQLNGSSNAIEEPRKLLLNKELTNNVIKSPDFDIAWLKTAVGFYQVVESSGYVSTLVIEPSPATVFVLINGSHLNGTDIEGAVWFRIVKTPLGSDLSITWRDAVGLVHEAQLADILSSEDSNFFVSTNERILEKISMRNLNADFYRW